MAGAFNALSFGVVFREGLHFDMLAEASMPLNGF
jgi:hypothetical protein